MLKAIERTLLLMCTILIFLIAWDLAHAHEFYDRWCCNENDCAPYQGKVETRPGGYWIEEFQTLIPYSQARVTPFHDEYEYHLCEFPKGTVRCFYAKKGGV